MNIISDAAVFNAISQIDKYDTANLPNGTFYCIAFNIIDHDHCGTTCDTMAEWFEFWGENPEYTYSDIDCLVMQAISLHMHHTTEREYQITLPTLTADNYQIYATLAVAYIAYFQSL